MQELNDTIVSEATGFGKAAISIIRLSGKNTFSILDKILKQQPSDRKDSAGYFRLVTIFNSRQEILDKCGLIYFINPKSYTGEDLAEIHCHGNPLLVSLIIQEIVIAGARPATAGEFTKRAFLNGKLTINQIEGIDLLINSQSQYGLILANQRINSTVFQPMVELKILLVSVLASIEVQIDYPEEDFPETEKMNIGKSIQKIIFQLVNLHERAKQSMKLVTGYKVILAGKPNVGKSSLLNKLAGSEKAIVTPLPGTTRDTIEVNLTIGGINVQLTDTAGIQFTNDSIEKLGIERSLAAINMADIVLWLDDFDPSSSWEQVSKQYGWDRKNILLILSKSDQKRKSNIENHSLSVSSFNGDGITEMISKISSSISESEIPKDSEIFFTQRQLNKITAGISLINNIFDDFKTGVEPDLIASDFRVFIDLISEMGGDISSEEVLSEVFKNFCVGK